MAIVQVNFISKCLLRSVTFTAILPIDKLPVNGYNPDVKMPFKSLYLLHGGYGSNVDYISGTRLQRWAEEKNLAVFMPSGENQFYLDNEDREEYYGQFVGQELVEFTRKMFPLSDKREDTFIAGLSMGGYGAIVNGLKYHETFGNIGLFSAGFILDDIINETKLIKGIGWKMSFWKSVYGPSDSLIGSDRDYCYLLKTLVEQKKEIPSIYMTIGSSDFLYEANAKYRKFMDELHVPYTYVEDEGAHEWDFWDRALKRYIDYLPLESSGLGLNSGNVRTDAE